MGDDATRSVDGQAAPVGSYRPKPPLRQPKPEQLLSRASRIGLVLLFVGSLAFLAVLLENQFLSVPIGQMEVRVVRIEAGRPSDETPAVYAYLVRLSDGSSTRFLCDRILRPGDVVLVTASRGRLTRRVRLSAPYRVVSGSTTDDHSRGDR